MKEDRPEIAQLRRGVLEHCVLALVRNDEHYGYDLVTALAEAGLVVTEGTVYPLLARLRKDGLVATEWRESDSGPPRKYYRATDAGLRRLDEFQRSWTDFRQSVDTLLNQGAGRND